MSYAVDQLAPFDMVAIIANDSGWDPLVEIRPADIVARAFLEAALERVSGCGETVLFHAITDLWDMMGAHIQTDILSHVIILTSGHYADDPATMNHLIDRMKSMHSLGISTSAIGVGRDINELLLWRMNRAGGGDYARIKDHAGVESVVAADLMSCLDFTWRQAGLSAPI